MTQRAAARFLDAGRKRQCWRRKRREIEPLAAWHQGCTEGTRASLLSAPVASVLSMVSLTLAVGGGGLLAGCAGGASAADGASSSAADDSSASALSSALSTSIPVGSTLETVANLNLRTGAGTDHSVILVIPDGATVTVQSATSTRGWYNVKYDGHVGYSAGQYLVLESSGSGGSDAGSGSGGDDSGTTSTAAVTRASSWVSAAVPYCGGINFGADSICGGTCERTGAADKSAWNSYRSDCSGFVSYAWGLAAPGLTTGGFAPYDTSASSEIDAEDLQPGDALNSVPAQHIVLFAGWADKASGQANIIEEYDCDHDATAHVLTVEFSSGSPSVYLPDWEPKSYRAIRKN